MSAGGDLFPVVEDETDEVQQKLRGQNLGAFAGIIGRGNLDQVDANDITAFAQPLQDFKHVVVLEATVAGGAGAGRD